MSCLSNELTLEQVTNHLLTKNAFEVDQWTSPEILQKTREFISQLPFSDFKLANTTDTLVFFVSEKISYLAEFTNGCSAQFMWMDFSTTQHFLKFLGVH